MRISDWSSDVCSSDLFLDLYDHFGGRENLCRGRDDLGPRLLVEAVVGADALARASLDQHAVAVRDELARALRRPADAIFVLLDFLRSADDHASLSQTV